MAAHFAWPGRTSAQDGSGRHTADDSELHYRVALWSKGSCVCLLGDDDAVGHPADCVVGARDHDFFLGYYACRGPPAGFNHSGCRSRLWGTPVLRSDAVCFTQTFARKYGSSHYVFWGALVRSRTEIILPKSSSRIERAFISRREELGANVTNEKQDPWPLATESQRVIGRSLSQQSVVNKGRQ